MPIKECQIDNKKGYKWGDAGKCYTGVNAKKNAIAQGIAIGDIGKYKMAASYNDYPKAASENAKRALEWIDKYGRDVVKAGTLVGLARANQLANGENITRDTIARMAAFYRHKSNSQISPEFKGKPWLDKGYVAWLLWGGDEGISWAQRKLKQIDGNYTEEFAGKKVSFDYDETLTKPKGMELAKQHIADGDIVYIISARHNEARMYKRADELGIPHSRIYGTGSNREKIQKIFDLGIDKHYDNNPAVVKLLKGKGIQFKFGVVPVHPNCRCFIVNNRFLTEPGCCDLCASTRDEWNDKHRGQTGNKVKKRWAKKIFNDEEGCDHHNLCNLIEIVKPTI